MKVVFVNAFKTKNPFNWITALWTKGKYSHCEFYFDYNDYRIFGASFTEGLVRWDKFEMKAGYEVYETTFSIKEENQIKEHCVKYAGKRYDYMGLFGFVFNSKDFNHKGKYFCSEIMSHILFLTGKFKPSKPAYRMSPNRLFKDLKPHLKEYEE